MIAAAAIGAGLWHAATALLTPTDTTSSFSPSQSKPAATPARPTQPSPLSDDLQSWIIAQQSQFPAGQPSQAQAAAAYAAASR